MIVGGLVDQGEEGEEGGVGFFFGVHAESGDEGEGGAAFEFGLAIGPGGDFVEGVGCAAKDVQAGLIAHVPSIEVGNPRIHEIGGKLLGVSGEDGEQLGFVNGLGPKRECQRVVVAVWFGEIAENDHG